MRRCRRVRGLIGYRLPLAVTLLLVLAAPAVAAPAQPAPAPAAPVPAATPAPTVASPATPATGPRPRIAITELTLAGEGAAPALAMQLQDGFVLALVRAGIDVLDSTDVAKRLAGAPELQGCETSPCLKRTGDLLGVPFVIRVKVDNAGNSYKMTARLFSTQGAAPAALPVAAQSRACDVCTAQEAREQMIRLADGLRPRIEEHTALPPPPPPRRDTGPSAWPAWTAVGAGVLGIAAGALVLQSAGTGSQRRAALGGALMGAGLTTSVVGLYAALSPGTSPGLALGARLRF
jgi:hypothetical protein